MKEIGGLDNFRVRKASPQESKRFDQCLYKIFKKQQQYFANHNNYSEQLGKLDIGRYCRGIQLSLQSVQNRYLITARIQTGKTIAQWTLNEKGEAIEHQDPRMIESF